MESSAEHVRRDEAIQPAMPMPIIQASATHAFDVTAELYAKSELEERLRRIDRCIEKARHES